MNYILLFFCVISNSAAGINYYVKTGGSDASNGLSDATAWGTIAKVNSFQASFNAGDSILFKRGDTFFGKISAGKSGEYGNHIVYAAYGTGTPPVITGFVKLVSWTNEGNGIFSKIITCESPVNMVFLNGRNTPMARWPKTKYLSIDSYVSNTSVTDAELPASPNWTGAEVVIRKNAWIIDRNLITGHTNQTLTYSSGSTYGGRTGYGYFIQNDLRLLTEFGEWFFDKSASRFYMFFGMENPDEHEIKVSTLEYNFNSQTNDYLTLENLHFTGSNSQGISLLRSGSPSFNSTLYVNLNNCSIMYGGGTGINGSYNEYVIVDNCHVQFMNNNGIILTPSGSNNTVKNSTIRDIGIIIGMGESGDGNYIGLRNTGTEALIRNNTLKRIGYIGIEYKGSNSIVENNLVDSFLLVKRDGGGIYTYYNNNHPSKDLSSGRIVRNNIVLNGFGMGEGTSTGVNSANGYYLDGFTSGVILTGNTAAYLTGAGFHGNIEADNNFSYNTVFEAKTFLSIQNWTAQVPAMINNTFKYNIFVSPKKGQKTGIKYVSNDSNLDLAGFTGQIKGIGIIDYNVYYSNLECFVVVEQTGSPYLTNNPYSLKKWIEFSAHDKHSSFISEYKDYKIISLGENKIINSTFDQNITGWSTSNSNNLNVNWKQNKTGSGNMEIQGKYAPFTYTVSANANTVLSGTTETTKNYLLKFKSVSLQPDKTMGVLLESASRNDFGNANFFALNDTLTQNEILIRNPPQDGTHLKFYPADGEVNAFFDDITVQEATIEDVDVYNFILFAYNATNKDSIINLSSPMKDAKRNSYTDKVTLQAWTSVVLFSNPEYSYTDIRELKKQRTLIIYPNPATSQLWLKSESIKSNMPEYFITDIQGKLLFKGRLDHTGNTIAPINISTLPAGMYLISVEGKDGQRQIERFVVNR